MYTTQTQIYKCTYLRVRDYGALTLMSCLVTFLDDLQRARRIQMYSHPHMHQQYQIVAAFETHYNEISLINKKKKWKRIISYRNLRRVQSKTSSDKYKIKRTEHINNTMKSIVERLPARPFVQKYTICFIILRFIVPY